MANIEFLTLCNRIRDKQPRTVPGKNGCMYVYNHNTECAICLTNISHGIQLRCGHVFHCECIETWWTTIRNCPLCRVDHPIESDSSSDDEE